MGNSGTCNDAELTQIQKRYTNIMTKLEEVNKADSKLSVKLANAAFVQKKFEIRSEFRNNFGKYGSVESVRFKY